MGDGLVVDGVIDEWSKFIGPFAEPVSVMFTFTNPNPEVMDMLYGIDNRTIEGEVVEPEVKND